MNAYLGIKYHSDHHNRRLIEAVSAALEACGWHTVCVTRDIEAWGTLSLSTQALMHRTFAAIDESDLIVIELSEKGVGLGIEAGYAYARGIPVVTIAPEGQDISTTLQGISSVVFSYSDMRALEEFFERTLPTLVPITLAHATTEADHV